MNALRPASADETSLAAELREARAALELERAARRRLERAVVEAADHERHRLAQMLHDTLCQSLSGIVLLSRVILRGLEAVRPEEAAEVAQLKEAIDCAADEVHHLVRWLRPDEGDSPAELVPALTELAQSVSSRVPCDFEHPEGIVFNDRFASAQLVRIAHQAVDEAAARSGVSRIAVSLSIQDGHVILTVRDDGENAISEPAAESVAALELMRLRAGVIGATFSNSFHASQGTTITCKLPQAS